MAPTSFDSFAKKYDQTMGDTGDYAHQKTIDPALFKTMGKIKNKIIYDIACGNGYISRKMINMGAKEVWASDISEELIKIAKKKYPTYGIKYLVRDGANFSNIPKNYFDLIVINMAIHYIKDIEKFFPQISNILKIGGRFVFTTPHLLREMVKVVAKISSLEDFLEKAKGYNKDHSELSYNVWTRENNLPFLSRPISRYVNTLSKNKLFVDTLIEPETKMLNNYKEKNEINTPIPLIYAMGAVKIASTSGSD